MKIADLVFDRRAPDARPEWLAGVFERLVWLLDDNGAEIHSSMRQWIESGDLERARVALAFTEVYLHQTRPEMVTAFDALCARFPACRERCSEILAQWDSEPGHG